MCIRIIAGDPLPCGEISRAAFIGMSSQKYATTLRGRRDFDIIMAVARDPVSTGFWGPFCENGDPFRRFKRRRSSAVLTILISLEVAYFEVA